MTNPFPNPFGGQTATAAPVVPPSFPPAFSTPTAQPAGAPVGAASQPFGAGDSPFGAPAPRPAKAPRLIDLHMSGQHRLILLAPVKVETVRNTLDPSPNATQDRMTVDIAVLDGPTIFYGGKPEDPRNPIPHHQQIEAPVLFENVWISNAGLVSACRIALANRRSGQGHWMVLGRLMVGPQPSDPQKQRPWLIGRPDLPADQQPGGPTEADIAAANAFLATPAALPMLNKPRG